MQPGAVGVIGMVEHERRTDLADRGGAIALRARQLQDGIFVEVIAAEMLVDIADHRVVLDEGDDGIAGGLDGITSEDRVAEGSGVAEKMPSRHARGIGHGEGREQRVRILEIDALVADRRHCGGGFGGDFQRAQSIGHEQDEIMGRSVLRERRASGKEGEAGGQHE